MEIEVDGGITPNNVAQVCQDGADIVVAGSAIYHTPDYKEPITLFRNKRWGIVEEINRKRNSSNLCIF